MTKAWGRIVAAQALVAASLAIPARADSTGLADLVDAAAQRLQVAEQVAAVKWSSHAAVDDPARIRQELAKVRSVAIGKHVDPDYPDYVLRVFGDQIDATEAIEYTRFADWKLNPAAAPTDAPDLSASRTTIDAYSETMLTQLAVNWDLLHSPACTAQLDAARSDVIRARALDALYQQALSTATRSYCS